MPEKHICIECGKSLKAIGRKRVNGNQAYNDWISRKYHKKCWSDVNKRNLINEYISLTNL